MRGDLQAELVDFDTWCPMAGYRELKLLIAHWYLQGRLLQNEDHSIILDHSRDVSLIAA